MAFQVDMPSTKARGRIVVFALLALGLAACRDAAIPQPPPARLHIFTIGSGAVQRSLAGDLPAGSQLTLTAVAAAGWVFVRWDGDMASANNPLALIVRQDQTCIAVFRPLQAADHFVSGQSVFGRNGYIEYVPGDRPLIVSVPHGGDRLPAEIPDRASGEFTQDGFVVELGREVADSLSRQGSGRPHLVICHLHRVKLDANREPGEGAAGNPYALLAWNEFQEFILIAKATIGQGLYVDLHGQSDDDRQQLGYLLSAPELKRSDSELDQPEIALRSSLRRLAQIAGVPFSFLVRGPRSLGGLLQERGYEAVPSPQWSHPGGVPYYDGGYNTQVHGSRDGGMVDGIQLEASHAVRFDAGPRMLFADALALALGDFLTGWYAGTG